MRGLKEKIKGTWRGLRHLEESPHEIALGLATGVFVSFFPIIPFQTIAALLLALLLSGNKISCFIGLHLHTLVFPLIPLMFVAEFELGHFGAPGPPHVELEGEHWAMADLLRHGWPVLQTMMLGAFILATPAAIAAYLLTRFGVEDWRKRHPRKDV